MIARLDILADLPRQWVTPLHIVVEGLGCIFCRQTLGLREQEVDEGKVEDQNYDIDRVARQT